MDAKPYEGKALDYVLITPAGYRPGAGYPLVILLHGVGASMYDLLSLCVAIHQTGYVFALPNGPYTVPMRQRALGYGWLGDRPGVEPVKPGQPDLETLLEGFIAEVSEQTGTSAGNIVIGGFSQGAGVALTQALLRPEAFAGAAVLSGRLDKRDQLPARLPAQRDLPILLLHGTQDTQVSIDHARENRDFLEQAGYALTYKEFAMSHEITLDVINELRDWLGSILPPQPVATAP